MRVTALPRLYYMGVFCDRTLFLPTCEGSQPRLTRTAETLSPRRSFALKLS